MRPSQPQPQLPDRPCLPPRPKAMEPRPEQISPPSPQQPSQQNETYQAPSAIYEEIQEDVVSLCGKLFKMFFDLKFILFLGSTFATQRTTTSIESRVSKLSSACCCSSDSFKKLTTNTGEK